jgi:hypothetical protein
VDGRCPVDHRSDVALPICRGLSDAPGVKEGYVGRTAGPRGAKGARSTRARRAAKVGPASAAM